MKTSSFALVLTLTIGACIPADTTVERGALDIHIGGDVTAQSGFTSDDGYAVTFESIRLPIAISVGTACTANVAEPTQIYDLHEVGAFFDDRGEDPSVCGALDVFLAINDPSFIDDTSTFTAFGPIIELRGTGVKSGISTSFDVLLGVGDGAPVSLICGSNDDPLRVPSGTVDDVVVELAAASLFRASKNDDGGPILFGPFAAADRAGDGVDTGDINAMELSGIRGNPYSGAYSQAAPTLANALAARLTRAFTYRHKTPCFALVQSDGGLGAIGPPSSE